MIPISKIEAGIDEYKLNFNLGSLDKYFLAEYNTYGFTAMYTFMATLNGHENDISIEEFEKIKNAYKIKNSDLDFMQLVLFGQKKNEVMVTYLLGLGIDLTEEQQKEFHEVYDFIKTTK